MKHLTSILAGTAAAAAMLLGTAAIPAMAQDNTIEVGVISPLTGRNAVQGEDIVRGIKLAVKRINNGYEVPMEDGSTVRVGPDKLGGKIKLIIEDTESRPASALSAVRKLVNADHVPVVLGVLSSGICVPTGHFTNQNKVVQISAACTSPELRKIGPYFFDVLGLDSLMGQALGKFAYEDSGQAKTFASFVANNPFGVGMEIQGCKKLDELGGQCVTKVRYRQGKSDYRADLRRTEAKHPDAVMFTAYGTDARLILKQAYELGIKVNKNWYADYPSLWSNEIAKTPEIGEGIKGLRPGLVTDFYKDEYGDAYKKAYGEGPTTAFGGYAYDSTILTALAIMKAKAHTSDAIKDNLRPVSKTYKGVTGDKAFDKDGMQVTEQYSKVIFKDGKLQPYEMKK